MRDVTRALEIWRGRQQPLRELVVEAPEALVKATQELWQSAWRIAKARIEEERKALECAVQGWEAKLEEMNDLAAMFESERNVLADKLRTALAELDTATTRVKILELQVASLTEVLRERIPASTKPVAKCRQGEGLPSSAGR